MIKLHQFNPSGNCYKVRLLLHQLAIPFETREVDLTAGETRTPEFKAMNPIARTPTVELEPGVFLAESNAILWYFAEGTPFIPSDRLERARMLQWMFFEQYSHEPYIAVARAWLTFFGVPAGKEKELEERIQKGYAALDVMEGELSKRPFFAGEHYSLADISLYAYTHVAEEGRFDLGRYPAIRSWFERVQAQPRHLRITDIINAPSASQPSQAKSGL
ncbi:glutathione S-transferase family protein [Corallococcus praedator]|uniref:Glutathione S-transferase family protein n=1 Tax=Corallococcus praedator TaxID=2316724 RepID=A0ABX9QG42_9BACT|nr:MULTISPECIES: glutathione S-transferase family protein [Corallococcus]RKH26637.1 glutathione S-transferase family protein [Corallococcus sp. CA031C]RKI06372.1 glutathione S-transferase family protein [Corallococcus praedator]